MSKHADRLAQQAADERDATADMNERQSEPAAPPPSIEPQSWASSCAGWRYGVHEKSRVEADGRWRCRWCYGLFTAPTDAERANNNARHCAVSRRQRVDVRGR